MSHQDSAIAIASAIATARNGHSAEHASSRAPGGAPLQVVAFSLAGQDYAFEITKVKEVIMPEGITSIPQVADYLIGLINLRGSLVPVVDLRLRLQLGDGRIDEHSRILITRIGTRTVGFIVDAVSQVMRVPRAEIHDPPETVARVAQRYITGVAMRPGKPLLILLDSTAILSDAELDRVTA